MQGDILHQYTDYMALVEIGGGYGEVARVDKQKLISLLLELPDDDIYISMVPHEHGKCIIAKPCELNEPNWWLLCPKTE